MVVDGGKLAVYVVCRLVITLPQSKFRVIRMHLVKISSDNIHVPCNAAQVVVGLAVTNVPCAKDLLNFSWNKKLAKLWWKIMCAVWDVQVTDY